VSTVQTYNQIRSSRKLGNSRGIISYQEVVVAKASKTGSDVWLRGGVIVNVART